MVAPHCIFRMKSEKEGMCRCANARFAYKGDFDIKFCDTCPVIGRTEFPSMLERVINFGGALATHVGNGLKNATPEQVEQRKLVCLSCDKFNVIDKTCSSCGCFMPEKVEWESSVCPLNKWKD